MVETNIICFRIEWSKECNIFSLDVDIIWNIWNSDVKYCTWRVRRKRNLNSFWTTVFANCHRSVYVLFVEYVSHQLSTDILIVDRCDLNEYCCRWRPTSLRNTTKVLKIKLNFADLTQKVNLKVQTLDVKIPVFLNWYFHFPPTKFPYRWLVRLRRFYI